MTEKCSFSDNNVKVGLILMARRREGYVRGMLCQVKYAQKSEH